MLNVLHVSSGVKAALLAVGVTTSAAAPATAPVPHTQAHTQVQVRAVPATKKAILMQIDHRLGEIERTQKTMLRGYETGGIYK